MVGACGLQESPEDGFMLHRVRDRSIAVAHTAASVDDVGDFEATQPEVADELRGSARRCVRPWRLHYRAKRLDCCRRVLGIDVNGVKRYSAARNDEHAIVARAGIAATAACDVVSRAPQLGYSV